MATNGEFELALDVFGQHVGLDIYAVVYFSAAERCHRERVGNRATLNRSFSTSTSVRLTPSTATDPLLAICAS